MARLRGIYFSFLICLLSQRVATQVYPYGTSNGDTSLAPSNDFAVRVDLDRAFPFGGKNHSTLYISDNGVISFDDPVFAESDVTRCRSLPFYYDVDDDGTLEDPDTIFAFWADVDISGTNSGNVYYRVSTAASLLETATTDVRNYFRSNVNFNAQVVIVVTWEHVSFYDQTGPPNPSNTFQAVLIHDGQESFVFLIYESITWVVGTRMGGDPNTGTYSDTQLGVAVVGFLMNDGTALQNMGYTQATLQALPGGSNVDVLGVYAYKVDGASVIDPTGTDGPGAEPTTEDPWRIQTPGWWNPTNETYMTLDVGETQIISSPNYPFDYHNNAIYHWFITAPSGYQVLIQILDFRTEECCDFLRAGTGETHYSNGSVEIVRLSGSPSQDIRLDGPKCWLEFESDYSVTERGFQLLLSLVNSTEEPTTDYPWRTQTQRWWNTDEPSTEDPWRTQTPWWWNPTNEPVRPTDHPRATTPTWWGPNTTEPTNNYTVPRNQSADTYVTLTIGETQTISSPNYPSNYPNFARYNWFIRAPPGYDVLIQFLDFSTEECCDHLNIGTGDSANATGSTMLARLSGYASQDIRIEGPTGWMLFTSDYSVTERGFLLQLSLLNSTEEPTTDYPWRTQTQRWWNTDETTTEDPWRTQTPWWNSTEPTTNYTAPRNQSVDVTLTVGESRTISSPNYPSNYPNFARYNWFIRAPPGYDVVIRFLDFSTEECCDHLNIGTGDSPNATGSTMLARLSGSASQDIRFEGPTGWMLFTSDYSVTGRGFLLRLSLVNSTEEPVTDGPWTQQPTWWWNTDEPTTDDPWTLQPTWWWNTDDPRVITPASSNVEAEAMIFVADLTGNEIYMADFSSDSLDSLTFSAVPLDSVFQPKAVDYDPDTRMVYWTESSGSIRRGNIDGTSQSVIISGLGNPEGIALSTRRGKIFWTDESHDRIMSANLNGSSQQVLIDTDIYRPRGIIVHPEQWVMFWTDWNYPSRIERANLEGGHRYVIVNSSLQWPNGLAFNADGSRIYWCDAGTDMIESVGLWGEDRMVHLATSSIHPFDLAVVDDSIVWTDWNYDAIGIMSNDNSSSYSFYYHNVFQNPLGVHVYKEAATDIQTTTPWWWNNPTTWWWGPTNYPPVDENVNLDVGVTRIISSPNYPSNYHDNALYNWYITAPSGYDVLIHFLDFSLESGYDYLRIGTGDSRTSPGSVQLESLTGIYSPADIVLDTPTSWMQFTSDGSVTHRGFQLQLSLSQSSPVRLVNGSNPMEGRVEVYAYGQWGTVCDDYWDLTDAGVVCRSMGFAGAEAALSNAAFGPGTGPIYLDNVHCSGYESSILNCSHNGLGVHDCSHYEDAGVRCTNSYGGNTTEFPTSTQRTTTNVGGADQLDCDFDSGLCGWTQDVTDSFNWSLLSGSTGSSNTGPSLDHTTGLGQYTYIETSSPRVQGDFARLTSPEVVALGMKCLQFYYHMYGSTIGTLNVYVSKVGDPLGIPVFQIVGEQGNSWNLTQVDITRADTDRFVVTLEGICGSSYTGDIAIDDIIMFSGSCSQGQGDDQLDCDFDSGLCDWTQDVTDSFDWSLLSGSTGSSNTGPSSDHTTGFGQYTYIETSSPRVQGDFARLTSPEVVALGMKCLQFYYHMYGSTIGTLNVYVSKVGDPLGIPVFQIVGEQGNSWNLTQVDIMRADTDRFVVTLEGIRGSSYTGDIAIDDIIMFSGSCSQGQEFTTPQPTTAEPAAVRLVNGNEPNEGRVEVLYNGVWGTVCDDSWDINDGRVVCRSLGYRDVISAPRYAHFGQGYGSIWMDNVHCSGDEAHIFDCPHNGFGNHNCGHSEDASVICAPDEETELTCNSTSMTLILDRNLLEIGDDAGDVHFEDESCVGYDHDNGHVAITATYDRCGTTQEERGDHIVYNNVVTYYKPRPENGTNGVITREEYLRIPITCILEREQVLGDSFVPRTGVVSFSEEEYGEFSLSLDRYTSSGFYEHANDSGEVVLGTPLYYGVHLTAVTNLTLLIDSCWATTSLNPVDDYRYDIIEQGCAVDSTTFIYSGPSPTFKGFRVDAFTFIRDYEKVYVHCSILVCDNEDPGSRCTQGCLSRARRSLQPVGSRSKPHTITNGPLSDASHFQQNNMVDENGGVENLSPSMIATVTALCVFIALTVIMSMMMMRMRRNRQELYGNRRVGVVEEDN